MVEIGLICRGSKLQEGSLAKLEGLHTLRGTRLKRRVGRRLEYADNSHDGVSHK